MVSCTYMEEYLPVGSWVCCTPWLLHRFGVAAPDWGPQAAVQEIKHTV